MMICTLDFYFIFCACLEIKVLNVKLNNEYWMLHTESYTLPYEGLIHIQLKQCNCEIKQEGKTKAPRKKSMHNCC